MKVIASVILEFPVLSCVKEVGLSPRPLVVLLSVNVVSLFIFGKGYGYEAV